MKTFLATIFVLGTSAIAQVSKPEPKPVMLPIEQINAAGICDFGLCDDAASAPPIYGCLPGYSLWLGTQEFVWKNDHREQEMQWNKAPEQRIKFKHPRWTYQCWINGKSPVDAQ